MSSPLSPVSTSNPSFHTPSVSRWGIHAVVLLSGLSVLGLLLSAIYFRYRSKPSSNFKARTLRRPPPPPKIQREPPFSTKEQHTSRLHQMEPCLNEIQKLPFVEFAEGLVTISVTALFEKENPAPRFDQATIHCSYENREFFTHSEPTTPDSKIEFFMPNMPFEPDTLLILDLQRTMTLKIDLQQESEIVFSKTSELEVTLARGVYRITRSSLTPPSRLVLKNKEPLPSQTKGDIRSQSPLLSITSRPLPIKTKTDSQTLFAAIPIENSHNFLLPCENIKFDFQYTNSKFIFTNQNKECAVVYLKLVGRESEEAAFIARSLPFFFKPKESKEFSPHDLIKRWRHGYHQQEAQPNLKLTLTAIQVTTYIAEETSSSAN